MILVPLFEPDVRNRIRRELCANVGFAALVQPKSSASRVMNGSSVMSMRNGVTEIQ